MEENDVSLPPDDGIYKIIKSEGVKESCEYQRNRSSMSKSEDHQTLFNNIYNLNSLDLSQNPISELLDQNTKVCNCNAIKYNFECYSDDYNTCEKDNDLENVFKTNISFNINNTEHVLLHSDDCNEEKNKYPSEKINKNLKKRKAKNHITPTLLYKRSKLNINKNEDNIDSCSDIVTLRQKAKIRDGIIIDNSRPIKLYGETAICEKCSKEFDKNAFFLYRRKFICLKCSLKIQDIRELSDWEAKPTEEKWKCCSRCNCKRSISRFRDGKKYCAYCSLKKRWVYQTHK